MIWTEKLRHHCLVTSRIKQQHWIVQQLEQQEIRDVAMGTSNPCSFSASNKHFSKSIQPRPLSPVKTIFKKLRWRRNWKLFEEIHQATKTCQICPFTFVSTPIHQLQQLVPACRQMTITSLEIAKYHSGGPHGSYNICEDMCYIGSKNWTVPPLVRCESKRDRIWHFAHSVTLLAVKIICQLGCWSAETPLLPMTISYQNLWSAENVRN